MGMEMAQRSTFINEQKSKRPKQAAVAVAAGGLLVSPLMSPMAGALAGPVVSECSAGIGTGSHHNLGWAIDRINNGNGEGANYGPIGTTITFALANSCVITVTAGNEYVIAENMNIQGPGASKLKLLAAGSADYVFRIDASALTPTNTTTLDATLHGLTIDGQRASRNGALLQATDTSGATTVTLDGVTVKGGNSTSATSGLEFMDGNAVPGDSHLNIVKSTFSGNVSTGNSAIYSSDLELKISGSTFDSNTSGMAPGNSAVANFNGPLSITDSTFHSNSGGWSSAAFTDSSLIVKNSTFDSNHGYAAGALMGYGVTSVSNSTFIKNRTNGAGAIFSGSDLSVSNSAFIDNEADLNGGAVAAVQHVNSTNSTYVRNRTHGGSSGGGGAIASTFGGALVANTFVDNSAGGDPGNTLWVDSAENPEANYELYGNIFVQSSASNMCFGRVLDQGANLSTTQCADSQWANYASAKKNISALVTRSQLDLQSLTLNKLGPTNSGLTKTMALGANSVARDYYTAAPLRHSTLIVGKPTRDQRGASRPQGAALDVGAFEAGDTCTPTTIQRARFSGNSSRLTAKTRAQLRKEVAAIAKSACHTVILNGYTATSGSGNAGKSERRSLATKRNSVVKNYLKRHLDAQGYEVTFVVHARGASNPLASNSTSKGRVKNRRVEISILKLHSFTRM